MNRVIDDQMSGRDQSIEYLKFTIIFLKECKEREPKLAKKEHDEVQYISTHSLSISTRYGHTSDTWWTTFHELSNLKRRVTSGNTIFEQS